MNLEIAPVAFDDPVAVTLVAALDADLDVRYRDADELEGEPDRAFLNLLTTDVAPPSGAFLVASLAGEPVGCGALRRHDPEVGEIKRMYVRPDARGRGVARALLQALEAEAAALGYRRLILETGDRQQEAIALYVSAGWTPIEAYGAYRHSVLSKCYEKALA